jgi:hypothetical protein
MVSKFRTDNNADDAVYPDAKILIGTQPASALIRANSVNTNTATFSVTVSCSM